MDTQCLAGFAVVLAVALAPDPSAACYCEDQPFAEVLADADLVFVGVVQETRTWLLPPSEDCCSGGVRWSATIAVDRFLLGYDSETPIRVGGGGTDCDVDATVLEVGALYAFAFATSKGARQPYRMGLCAKSWARIRRPKRSGGFELPAVRHARRGDLTLRELEALIAPRKQPK
jgi:hypothetical protein